MQIFYTNIEEFNISNYKSLSRITPLGYPGGKSNACEVLDNILNKYFDMKKIKK